MSAAERLREYEGRGWRFRLDGGDVIATPVKGATASPADVASLRAIKPQLMAELQRREMLENVGSENLRKPEIAPCPSELIEAAALIEDRDGTPDGRDAAAVSMGFADFEDATRGISASWRERLYQASPATPEATQARKDALGMVDSWGADLAAAGWPECALFGCDPQGLAHGLAFRLRGGHVEAVEADVIQYRAGRTGRISTFNRNTAADDAAPIWEASQ